MAAARACELVSWSRNPTEVVGVVNVFMRFCGSFFGSLGFEGSTFLD